MAETAFAEIVGWIVCGLLILGTLGAVLLPAFIFVSILGWIDSKVSYRK